MVATRIVGGHLPDQIGAARCAVGAALVEAVGLFLLGAAQSLPVAILGAMAMGAAFSLLFPALSLLAVDRVVPERRGAAMGTFTASFDLGMLVGSPAVGAAAGLWRLQRRFLPRLRLRSRLRGALGHLHRIGASRRAAVLHSGADSGSGPPPTQARR